MILDLFRVALLGGVAVVKVLDSALHRRKIKKEQQKNNADDR